MSKRVLFAGDSITRGKVGIGYLPILAVRFPGCELVNLGKDGDTLAGIRARTLIHLREMPAYDLLVIAAGHNDVILPEFARRSIAHRAIARGMARRGSVPSRDYDEFLATYRGFLSEVWSLGDTPVVAVTMSAVNENPSSSTAARRARYNDGIRELAAELRVSLADVGEAFDRVLGEHSRRDYLLPSPATTVLTDAWRSRSADAANALSRTRGLHLTIDGVHLNSRGAGIYATTITDYLAALPVQE